MSRNDTHTVHVRNGEVEISIDGFSYKETLKMLQHLLGVTKELS